MEAIQHEVIFDKLEFSILTGTGSVTIRGHLSDNAMGFCS